MKNLFACALLLSLLFSVATVGEGFQKRRPAPRKRTKKELSSKMIRFSIDELRRENEKAVEAIKSANESEAKVSSFIVVIDSFTRQLIGKVLAEAKPLEGVKQAQEFFDARKAEMKARFDVVNCIPESKVSAEFIEEMKTHFYNDGVLIGKMLVIYGSDPIVQYRLQKLTRDFLELFEMKEPCPVQSIAVL